MGEWARAAELHDSLIKTLRNGTNYQMNKIPLPFRHLRLKFAVKRCALEHHRHRSSDDADFVRFCLGPGQVSSTVCGALTSGVLQPNFLKICAGWSTSCSQQARKEPLGRSVMSGRPDVAASERHRDSKSIPSSGVLPN